MSEITLIKPSAKYAEKIEEYRAEFPAERERVTYDPSRIPGMDYLEKYDNVHDWLQFCENMSDKLTWYMAIRQCDSKIVGFIVFRHKLEYDDDDIEFASNFGYSVCPSERGNGYAKEQLRLGLQKAKAFGLDKVRIICSESNIGSNKTIISNSGIHVDTIHGEKSGLNVNRYDIHLNINLVKASLSDAESLLEIQKICFTPHLERYQDFETSPATVNLDKIKWQIETENFYKILLGEIWIGSINVRKLDELGTYKLHIINILPSHQGNGFGQLAIKLAENLFPKSKLWCLETLEDMPENRHVYEKAGYNFTGKTEKINDKLTLVYYQKIMSIC